MADEPKLRRVISSEIERAEKDGEPSRRVDILRSWLKAEVDQ